MSVIQFSIFIGVFCMGTWGLLAGGMMQYAIEIFLGMVAPLIIGVIFITYISFVNKKTPGKVTNVLYKSFAIKMITYGAYFICIFTFYTFNPIPFILSFFGYFITLHMIEALFLRSIFK